MEKKKISLTVYIITLIIMIVIIAILGFIIVKNNNSKNNDSSNTNNININSGNTNSNNNLSTIPTTSNTENETNESINVNQVDNKENLQKVLEQYLYLYELKDSGATILTKDNGRFPYALDLYKTYEELEKDLKESNEKIVEADGFESELYQTSIRYSDYKAALLNYMSENLFEENFTEYQKDINGMLYVILSRIRWK